MRKKPPPRRKPRWGSFSEGQGQMPLSARCCSFRPHSRTSRRGGVLPRPRGTMLRYGYTDANTHAPVGADASVRPAVCTREHARTDANPYNICRGRCPRCAVLPKMRAILRLRAAGESAASTPTDVLRCCRLVVRFCDCILRGRGRAPLLRLDLECAKNREKVIAFPRLIHSASSVFFIIVCSGLCLAAKKFQIFPNTRGFR